MKLHIMAKQPKSAFMLKNIPILLQRYTLSYYREGRCIEYFINRHDTAEAVSSALVFSSNPTRKDLHISRFYPELTHQPESKYLSAACFYILVHHCADSYSLDNTWHISLETVETINNSFYNKLRDFDFHINKHGLGKDIELTSSLMRTSIDTDMIEEHIFEKDEIPLLKC